MSSKKSIKIKCPKCGKETEFEVWQLVNVTKEPNLKEQIFSQDIFHFNCAECKKNIMILYSLIYHDEEKKVFIHFNPDNKFENAFHEDGYIIKQASDYLEFLEIIKIIDDGIDEALIDNAKKVLLAQFVVNENLKNINKLYYAGLDGDKTMFFVPQINSKISIKL